MTAFSAKKINILRWNRINLMALQILGIADQPEFVDDFYRIGFFIAKWTDLKGKPPTSNDLIACKTTILSMPIDSCR